MEKVTLLSASIIAIIFVLGFISSHIERRAVRGKVVKTNTIAMASIPQRGEALMAGTDVPGNTIGGLTSITSDLQAASTESIGESNR